MPDYAEGEYVIIKPGLARVDFLSMRAARIVNVIKKKPGKQKMTYLYLDLSEYGCKQVPEIILLSRYVSKIPEGFELVRPSAMIRDSDFVAYYSYSSGLIPDFISWYYVGHQPKRQDVAILRRKKE